MIGKSIIIMAVAAIKSKHHKQVPRHTVEHRQAKQQKTGADQAHNHIFCRSNVLSGRLAKRLSLVLVGVAGVMNAFVLRFVTEHGQYTYPMGHFPAPFGNEIRVGSLEALLAVFFCAIMFLSVLGGEHYIDLEVEETKENLYFTMVNLMLASLLALIYTNDMFTAYVFVEITIETVSGIAYCPLSESFTICPCISTISKCPVTL